MVLTTAAGPVADMYTIWYIRKKANIVCSLHVVCEMFFTVLNGFAIVEGAVTLLVRYLGSAYIL